MKNLFSRFSRLPYKERRITVSTFFTLARIILVPFVVGAMVTQLWGVAFVLFVIAAATDVIDGSLARLRDEKTLLGAYLDPLADKLLIVACFATLAFVQSPLFAVPQWFFALILLKESMLIGGTLFLYLYRGIFEVKASLLGKMTMLMQVCFIAWLFACYFFHWLPIKTYYTMLGLLMVLVVASLVQYTYRSWSKFIV